MTQNQNDLSPNDTDYQKMIDDLYQSLQELTEIHKKLEESRKN